MEWLAIWGLTASATFVFRPILEKLACDIAKDISKSYVKRCFQNVFSVLHKKPLAVATGRTLKKLLELIQDELLDAQFSQEALKDWIDDVQQFTEQEEVRDAIAGLLQDPDSQDPTLLAARFATAWTRIEPKHLLPEEFNWQRVASRLSRKTTEIRQSTAELSEAFSSRAADRMSDNVQQMLGVPQEFDLYTYREALIECFGKLDLEAMDPTGAYYEVGLRRVFVPQSVRECQDYSLRQLDLPKEYLQRLAERGELDLASIEDDERIADRRREYFNRPIRPVLEVADDPAQRLLVVLGDPGSGKSTLLRYLALRWAQLDVAKHHDRPIPLLIELRKYDQWTCTGAKDFTRFFHEASTYHRLNQIVLDKWLKDEGNAVLLLDGLDEIFDPNRRATVVNDIQRFSNEYKKVQIVVTSRTIGYQPQRLRDVGFEHYMLQDLSKEQVDQFIELWHTVTFTDPDNATSKRERLCSAIDRSGRIRELAGNPLLLTLMAILNRHKKLPDNRVELYRQASELLLHQWDTCRALEGYPKLQDQVGFSEKFDILRGVANTMQSGPHGLKHNLIDGPTLINQIETYLQKTLNFNPARGAARDLVKQLRERNFILCTLGAETYAFVHRTFLEYFCAAEFVHQFKHSQSLSIDKLIELFDTHCLDDSWHEVLRLICAQIDEPFVGQIIDHLISRNDMTQWNGDTSLPEIPLAIHCLSEVGLPNKVEPQGERLMRQTMELFKRVNFLVEIGYFNNQILPACRSIGTRWPGRHVLRDCATAPIRPTADPQTEEVPIRTGFGKRSWPHLVASVLADRPSVEAFATTDVASSYRSGGLTALASHWPDETTRKLLTERAVVDENGAPRRDALSALASHWPDETTRKLLTERAVVDEYWAPRRDALSALASHWPDETTRKLLTERAVVDEDNDVRSDALSALASHWPDETTRKLLRERARVNGFACFELGKQHSEFGRVLSTHDVDGLDPYLDPRHPIPSAHITKAAARVGVLENEIDEMVRSLSEHLGWDVTKGSENG